MHINFACMHAHVYMSVACVVASVCLFPYCNRQYYQLYPADERLSAIDAHNIAIQHSNTTLCLHMWLSYCNCAYIV